jgi:hypothetical protein
MPHYRETLVPQLTKEILSAGDFCGSSLSVSFDRLHCDFHQAQARMRQSLERSVSEVNNASISDQSPCGSPVGHSNHHGFLACRTCGGDQQLGPQGIEPGSRGQSVGIERFAIRHGPSPVVLAVPGGYAGCAQGGVRGHTAELTAHTD